jgi:hypothetical protein
MYEKLFNSVDLPDDNSPDLTDIQVACLGNKTAVDSRPWFNSYGTGYYTWTPLLFSSKRTHIKIFFFQTLNFLVESFGLLNDLFPFPSILDAGYPVFLSSFGRCPV